MRKEKSNYTKETQKDSLNVKRYKGLKNFLLLIIVCCLFCTTVTAYAYVYKNSKEKKTDLENIDASSIEKIEDKIEKTTQVEVAVEVKEKQNEETEVKEKQDEEAENKKSEERKASSESEKEEKKEVAQVEKVKTETKNTEKENKTKETTEKAIKTNKESNKKEVEDKEELKGTFKQSEAKKLVSLVNKDREEAGVCTIKWDSGLEKTAKKRAIEISEYYSHTRPDGTDVYSMDDDVYAENIAKGPKFKTASIIHNEGWMQSQGHKENVLRKGYTKMGAALYVVDGVNYWVQLFGY